MGQFDKHTCSNKDDVGRQDFKDKAIWGKHSRWTLCTWILWACTTNSPGDNPNLRKMIPTLLAIEDNYYYQLTIWGDKLWGDQLNNLRRPVEDLRGPMQWTICRDELNWGDESNYNYYYQLTIWGEELNYEGISWTTWGDQLKIWGDQCNGLSVGTSWTEGTSQTIITTTTWPFEGMSRTMGGPVERFEETSWRSKGTNAMDYL